MKPLPTVHILFENPDWNPPLLRALKAEGFAYELHYLDEGMLDPSKAPAEGIWLNRISPSSHTRAHTHTVSLAREVIFWLEAYGRTVINGSAAFEVEMSKIRQDLILRKHGIRTPRTVLAIGREHLLAQARTFDGPFITKHNQGGKGLGIHLFETPEQLASFMDSEAFDSGPEGKMVLQQYIQPAEPFITRVELVGDRFLFAMRSRTDEGFQLCPSDACQRPATAPEVCPADGRTEPGQDSKFSLSPLTADDPLVEKMIGMIQAEGIGIAGIEFVQDAAGDRYTYDINGTTNYSGVLGSKIGIDGMREVAHYLRGIASRLEHREHAA